MSDKILEKYCKEFQLDFKSLNEDQKILIINSSNFLKFQLIYNLEKLLVSIFIPILDIIIEIINKIIKYIKEKRK